MSPADGTAGRLKISVTNIPGKPLRDGAMENDLVVNTVANIYVLQLIANLLI